MNPNLLAAFADELEKISMSAKTDGGNLNSNTLAKPMKISTGLRTQGTNVTAPRPSTATMSPFKASVGSQRSAGAVAGSGIRKRSIGSMIGKATRAAM